MTDSSEVLERHIHVEADVAGCHLRVARKNLEYEEGLDPYMFEPDYTIAGSTGFLLWPGTWVLLELLAGRLGQQVHGKRVVELGAGVGLAGLGAAAAGAHVLMTDLPSVVSGILEGNVSSNACASETAHEDSSLTGPWARSLRIGLQSGSAACFPLNWEDNLQAQFDQAAMAGLPFGSADMLLACDVVWLKDLLEPFRDTVMALLRLCKQGTACLLTFLDRGKGGTSEAFSSAPQVAAVFSSKGCTVSTYHSQSVQVDGDMLEATVMEIKLKR
mmetsp:Transcript_22288/g.66456  ORF Transcript_22288/g.66456 Transcript_22288/m.66456 type:complete len:273 (-) Transcript_22288:2073-2891(-)|eukprot:359793-Chlamydomonas_euryale.AAC.9